MKAAKYLVIVYLSGLLATLGWMAYTTVNLAACVESVTSCLTVLQALLWTGIDWPYFWGSQWVGPGLETFRAPKELVPIGVLGGAMGMAAFGYLTSGRRQARCEVEGKRSTSDIRKKDESTLARETAETQRRDPGGRCDQSLQPSDF